MPRRDKQYVDIECDWCLAIIVLGAPTTRHHSLVLTKDGEMRPSYRLDLCNKCCGKAIALLEKGR